MDPVLRAIQGKRVVRVVSTPGDDSQLMLDDGTLLTLFMSESDCCASAAGGWVVRPDDLDAVITNVEVVPDEERSGYDGDGTTNFATVTILHNQNPIALAECYANDGNGGYYYSILSLKVNVPGEDAVQVAVLGA